MGAKDARHIIKTISHVGRHSEFTGCLNFYVHEDQAPLLARTILLLSVFLDQESEVNNEEQAHLFLEFFGNIYLRSKSYDQMKEIATKLLMRFRWTLAPLFNFRISVSKTVTTSKLCSNSGVTTQKRHTKSISSGTRVSENS
ncbi:hypothetical protein BCR33DRAFT_338009 [Rhizoclosmatium globosum]|uniref:DUF4470 domain-containing protein n=1 Tax=Rhizoclosmatium globosum TaxID=329046 RepID=A0A1Y2C5W9_9FUNG|nr:hypothetical protein BCR33DRAFT_338009 [Rhizoclosmatium globosum]|eukprot:ORY41695.1 hypothetical protein BCR33DRAFT_338009 [Rhizoclosmatium globosum]